MRIIIAERASEGLLSGLSMPLLHGSNPIDPGQRYVFGIAAGLGTSWVLGRVTSGSVCWAQSMWRGRPTRTDGDMYREHCAVPTSSQWVMLLDTHKLGRQVLLHPLIACQDLDATACSHARVCQSPSHVSPAFSNIARSDGQALPVVDSLGWKSIVPN